MNAQIIHISGQRKASLVRIYEQNELAGVGQELRLPVPMPVQVLVGGAGLVDPALLTLIHASTRLIAKVAEENHALILDGGTQSGVMESIGLAREQGKHTFPLVGVAAEGTVTWPGRQTKKRWLDLFKKDARAALDPNHTHFILVPGQHWGDEAPWIARAATAMSGEHPSLTILINGGEIARQDVAHSLQENRPVVVLKGTGRYADELASQTPSDPLIHVVAAEHEAAILDALQALITTG